MSKCNIVCAAILHGMNLWIGTGRPLPPNLHVQLDNCSGDNKNHTVLGFLAHLVGMGIFAGVQVRLSHKGLLYTLALNPKTLNPNIKP